jgi:hypothetical protein
LAKINTGHLGSPMDGCGGGEVHAGAGVCPRWGSDAARRGEVRALPRRWSLLLGGAPAVASMKGPLQLRRRGPSTGAAAAMKGSRHGGGGGGDGVPAAAVRAPVASLMVVRWRQRVREMKIGK